MEFEIVTMFVRAHPYLSIGIILAVVFVISGLLSYGDRTYR